MKRPFRLRSTQDIHQVRDAGKSFVDPLLVLVALENQGGKTRMAVVVNKAIGMAVLRNRYKRMVRAVFSHYLPDLKSGYDIVLIIRKRMKEAQHEDLMLSMRKLLNQAQLFKDATS